MGNWWRCCYEYIHLSPYGFALRKYECLHDKSAEHIWNTCIRQPLKLLVWNSCRLCVYVLLLFEQNATKIIYICFTFGGYRLLMSGAYKRQYSYSFINHNIVFIHLCAIIKEHLKIKSMLKMSVSAQTDII